MGIRDRWRESQGDGKHGNSIHRQRLLNFLSFLLLGSE